jgi:hypothetical protein
LYLSFVSPYETITDPSLEYVSIRVLPTNAATSLNKTPTGYEEHKPCLY